jgi:hypothetical protein
MEVSVERTSSGGWGAGARTGIDLRSPQDIYNILHNQGEIVYFQQLGGHRGPFKGVPASIGAG